MPRAPGTETISKRLEAERPEGRGESGPPATTTWWDTELAVSSPFCTARDDRVERIDVAGHRHRVHRHAGRAGEVASGAGQVERHGDGAGAAADRAVRQLIGGVDPSTRGLIVDSRGDLRRRRGRGLGRLRRPGASSSIDATSDVPPMPSVSAWCARR